MSVNGHESGLCVDNNILKWNISGIIEPETSTESPYAILILNRPITQSHKYFLALWNNAVVRVTVDGGTTQWDRYISSFSQKEQEIAKGPDLVTGDFDSITEEILEKYKTKGCKVIHTPDQNYTDFTKALMELNNYCRLKCLEIHSVIVVGQTSGRLDQIMGNIQTMFLCKEKQLLCSRIRLYLMSDESLSWLLFSGKHCISIPEEIRKHKKPWCSLVPIGEKCESVTTEGLKWNLHNQKLKFGELVSTSNTYNIDSPVVLIQCSDPILWSMKVPSLMGH